MSVSVRWCGCGCGVSVGVGWCGVGVSVVWVRIPEVLKLTLFLNLSFVELGLQDCR